MKFTSLTLLLFLLFSLPALADVPGEMTFNGMLTDENGLPLNETLSVTLSLCDAPTGGNTLWTETKSVNVANGFLNVTVGDTNPIDANLIDGETALFLGVTIGDDEEMSPRQPITSVPYATRASTVENVTGDITPNSVTVNGQLIIDEDGLWVGSPTGLQGPQGERGERGPQGYAGESVTMWSADAESCPTGGVGFRVGNADDQYVCNGAQGERGMQGEPGAQGERGLSGEPGAQGERGLAGEPGAQGERGLPGEPGAKGDKGDKGDTGDSVVSWSADVSDCPTGGIGFRVGSGVNQFVCNGEQGIQGLTGLTGAKGDKGDQGDQGDPGLPGAPGEQGLQGAKGDKGDKGDQGDQGDQGIQGLQGVKGDKGDKGDTGERGLQGIQGIPGTSAADTKFGTGTGWGLDSSYSNRECFLGEIILSAGRLGLGMEADGRLLPISTNSALYSLLGTKHGGNGTTTFALPNLQSAAPNNLTYYICTQGIYPMSN